MFRSKHVYTCPDVIYNMALAKRRTRQIVGAELLIAAAVVVVGYVAQKKMDKDIENHAGPEEN